MGTHTNSTRKNCRKKKVVVVEVQARSTVKETAKKSVLLHDTVSYKRKSKTERGDRAKKRPEPRHDYTWLRQCQPKKEIKSLEDMSTVALLMKSISFFLLKYQKAKANNATNKTAAAAAAAHANKIFSSQRISDGASSLLFYIIARKSARNSSKVLKLAVANRVSVSLLRGA